MAVVSTIKSRGRLHVWSLRFGGKDKSTLLNAKPCTLCKMVMLKRGVKKVTYSNNFGELCSEKLETLETQASIQFFLIRTRGGPFRVLSGT